MAAISGSLVIVLDCVVLFALLISLTLKRYGCQHACRYVNVNVNNLPAMSI